MLTSILVDAILEELRTPYVPNIMLKTNYSDIKEIHQLLAENVSLAQNALGRIQNGYIGIVLLPEQYEFLTLETFVRPPNPGITATVPSWNPTGEEHSILHEYEEARRVYNEFRAVDNPLNNQLVTIFMDAYLLTLRNSYTKYSTRKIPETIYHI